MNIKINTQFVLDITISAYIMFINMMVMMLTFPKGLTTNFLERGSKLVFLFAIVSNIIFLIFWYNNKNFNLKKKIEFPKLIDFVLLMFPMSPLVGYIMLNLNYLDSLGFIYLIILPLLFCLFIGYLIPILLSYFASLKMLMISGIALNFTILSMATITENPSNHFFNSQFITQGLYLIISFTVIYLLYLFDKRIAYTLTIFFFLSTLSLNYINNFSSVKPPENQSENRLKIFLKNKNNEIIIRKNIYVIVYESYPNEETLNFYGFDNSKQIKFLKKNNFKIYNGIYSGGGISISSTSRILELNDQLPKHGRYYLSGNSFVTNIFKANDYETIGIFKSPYFFGSHPITWDKYYPKEDVSKIGGKIISKAIFEGEFRFDIFDDNYNYEEYLKLKKKYFSSKPKKNALIYTHNKYPGHSQNSGTCRTNEKEIYFTRMEKANLEMKNDVNNIKESDPNAIIILLADHGPYLTKNCRDLVGFDQNSIDRYDIQDRYGTFLAIHWPNDLEFTDYEIQITQDIFPAILGNITKNKKLFDQLKLDRKFSDRFDNIVSGINVKNGVIVGGKNDGQALFENRSYNLGTK